MLATDNKKNSLDSVNQFSSPSSGDKLLAFPDGYAATRDDVVKFSSPSSGDKLLAIFVDMKKYFSDDKSSRLLLAEISC